MELMRCFKGDGSKYLVYLKNQWYINDRWFTCLDLSHTVHMNLIWVQILKQNDISVYSVLHLNHTLNRTLEECHVTKSWYFKEECQSYSIWNTGESPIFFKVCEFVYTKYRTFVYELQHFPQLLLWKIMTYNKTPHH